jgi:hypothetical protein
MKINLETKFNVGETVLMDHFAGLVEVDIFRVNVNIDEYQGLVVSYDVKIGIDIYHDAVPEDQIQSLSLVV